MHQIHPPPPSYTARNHKRNFLALLQSMTASLFCFMVVMPPTALAKPLDAVPQLCKRLESVAIGRIPTRNRKELTMARAACSRYGSAPTKSKKALALRIQRTLVNLSAVIYSANASGEPLQVFYLSDLYRRLVKAQNAWGPFERDHSNGETAPNDGGPITLDGRVYAKGLGVHAYSELTFDLSGQCTTLLTTIGIDDETDDERGSSFFKILGNGRVRYSSQLLRKRSPAETVVVDIVDVSALVLRVEDGADSNWNDHADWADARIVCKKGFSDGGVTPTPTATGTPPLAPTRTATPTPSATPTSVGEFLPAPPSNLHGYGASTTSIALAWNDNSNNEDGFIIQRRSRDGVDPFIDLPALPANTTSFEDSGLNDRWVYVYRVFAFNASGRSAASNEAIIQVLLDPVTPTPTPGGGHPTPIPQPCSCGNFSGQVIPVLATVNDGIDDSTAFNNAMNAARPGDKLLFPSGTVDFTRPVLVKNGRRLEGQAGSRVNFNLAGSSDDHGFRIEGNASDVCISGLDMRSNRGLVVMSDGSQYGNVRIINNAMEGHSQDTAGRYVVGIYGSIRNEGLKIECNYFHDSFDQPRVFEIFEMNNASYSYNALYKVADGGHIMNARDNVIMRGNVGRFIHRMAIEIQETAYPPAPPGQWGRDLKVEENVYYDWHLPYYDSMGFSVPRAGNGVWIRGNYVRHNAWKGNWGQPDDSGYVRGSYGIEASQAPDGTGWPVEYNILGGERDVVHVSCPGRSTPVRFNEFYGTPSWGWAIGEPGAQGHGSCVEQENVHQPDFRAMPPPPVAIEDMIRNYGWEPSAVP